MTRTYQPSPLTDKPAESMTVDECRAEYRAIRVRWHFTDDRSIAIFNSFCRGKASDYQAARREAGDLDPRDWLRAARAYSERCHKCGGTGVYGWGPVTNGRPAHSGICFACQGKGKMTDADRRRDWGYWNFYARIDT